MNTTVVNLESRNGRFHGELIQRFQTLFNTLQSGRIGGLEDVYDSEIEFIDPFTSVRGLPELERYFSGVYENVIHCQFSFGQAISDRQGFCLPWTMHLRHPKLRSGKPIDVLGMSHLLVTEELIVRHRDYFDAGQLIYENVPVLGPAVRWIRRQAT